MPRLPRVTSAQLIRVLQRVGFGIVRQAGSHVTLRDSGGHTVIVASHPGNVPIGTLASILKQAGMSGDQLRAAL